MFPEVFLNKVRKNEETGCWIWQGNIASNGYGRIMIDRVSWYTHRLSWTLFHGPIPEGKWVLHTCDVRACANPAHLYLGDHQRNNKDAFERSNFHNKKLIKEDVHEIRRLRKKGVKQKEIAYRYGVAMSTITAITLGKSWKHLATDEVKL